MNGMLDTLAGLYRAWPWRPRCRRAAGIHALPCRLAMPVLAAIGHQAPPSRGGWRCTAKDN